MSAMNKAGLLRRLGLPPNLLQLIREGRLLEEVDRAYESYERSERVLDAWEAANPELARRAPWYEGREAWKRAGRPVPAWYELLYAQQVQQFDTGHLQDLLPNTGARYKRRAKMAR